MHELLKAVASAKLLTQDSRQAAPGVIFFAISGQSRDGHDFIETVLANGASVVAQKNHPKTKPGKNVFLVTDTREALGLCASAFYKEPSKNLTVCGVTGTNGKTTSTYLLESVLKAAGLAPGVLGTVENRFGDHRVEATHTTPGPVELQKIFRDFLDRGAKSIAMEVSSHALDQKRVFGTHFTAALFTNLTQDHLDYHPTLEEYFQAKTKLFLDYAPKARVVHAEDAYGKKLVELCRAKGLECFTFASHGANLSYGKLKIDAKGICGEMALEWKGKRSALKIRSPLLGAFNAQNLAGVAGVAIALGFDHALVSSALENAKPVPGRMQTIPNSRDVTVVVDYAHTPDALDKALKTLRQILPAKKKLLCVFGCGGDRDKTKRPVMGKIAETTADRLIVTSDNPRAENPESILDDIFTGLKAPQKAKRIADRREAIAYAIKELSAGDILLVAGKGHEDYQIIGTTKLPFDDRTVAAENLQ